MRECVRDLFFLGRVLGLPQWLAFVFDMEVHVEVVAFLKHSGALEMRVVTAGWAVEGEGFGGILPCESRRDWDGLSDSG
jgi:hypothetical protein